MVGDGLVGGDSRIAEDLDGGVVDKAWFPRLLAVNKISRVLLSSPDKVDGASVRIPARVNFYATLNRGPPSCES